MPNELPSIILLDDLWDAMYRQNEQILSFYITFGKQQASNRIRKYTRHAYIAYINISHIFHMFRTNELDLYIF